MQEVQNVSKVPRMENIRAVPAQEEVSLKPFVIAGVLLGLGLGGFFDGIVLHQVLQWHHMVSADYPPTTVANLELNTLLDGFFHVLAYLFTLSGLLVLWQTVKRTNLRCSTGCFVGAFLIGWGLFNLIEGLIDHHLLAIHHVRAGPNQLAWDLGFLIWGAVMVIGGWLLIRNNQGLHHLS